MFDRKRKICMLVTSELEWDARVQKEAKLAYQSGYDVVVICRSYSGPNKGYKILPLDIPRQEKRFMKYAERFLTNVALVFQAVKNKPDVIHANDMDTLMAGYIACKLSGAKLLYDAHELWSSAGRDVGSIGQKLLLKIEKYISQRADAVVAVSKYRAERMAEILSIPLPTVVMNTPEYISTDGLLPREWEKQFEGRRIVLYQGRYAANRGIEEAVLAAKCLPEDVALVFRGYGAIEEELRKLVLDQQLSEMVFFLPPVQAEEIVEYAIGADIGLSLYTPYNQNNLYAAPNKMFEYMMAGVPSVGSDLPYINDILVGLNVGKVFEPGDAQHLASVIVELLDDAANLEKMRKKGLELSKTYCWEAEGKKLLQDYEGMIASK